MRNRLSTNRHRSRVLSHACVEALETRRMLVGVTLHGPFPGGTQGGDNYSKYLLTDTALTVPLAQVVAGKVGETLATINGADENAFVSAINPASMWIGLAVQHHPFPLPYDLFWDSGQPVTYTSWGVPTEPNNTNGSESRVAINQHRPGGWNDLTPSIPLRSVVEIELGGIRFGQLTTFRNRNVVFSSGIAADFQPIVIRALDYDLNIVAQTTTAAMGGVWECEFKAPEAAVWVVTQYEGVLGTSDITLIGTPPAPPPANGNLNHTYHRTVNLANGNVNRSATDFSIPARGTPLEFTRSYNSDLRSDFGMGQGWTFSWSDRITVLQNGSLIWVNSEGQSYTFPTDGAGGYVTPNTLRGQMLRVGTVDGPGYWFTDNHGYRHTFGPTEITGSYRLLSTQDRYGNGQTVSYQGNSHRIAAVTDTADASRVITFAYAPEEHVTGVSDFTGRSWTYDYTLQPYVDTFQLYLLSSADGPLSLDTQYLYTAADLQEPHEEDFDGGLLRELRDAENGRTTYGYHLDGRNAFVRDSLGHTTVISSNLLTSETVVRDPGGGSTLYRYGAVGELIQVSRSGSTDRYTWDRGLLRKHVDPLGRTESYDYDARGNLTRFTDLNGEGTTRSYDPLYNQLLTETDPKGHTTLYQYDVAGNNTTVVDPAGQAASRTYDSFGQLLTKEDARGNTTSYAYNNAGQVTLVTAPLQTTRTFAYDDRGNVTLEIDAKGNETTRAYDALSRLTSSTDALGKRTSFTYDALGNVLTVEDRLGRRTSYAYDALHRLTRTTLPDGTVTQLGYNSTGKLVREVNQLGRTTSYDYDSRGRRTKITDPLGRTTITEYDAASRVTRTVDALQRATSFTYDHVGRLLSTTDALGNTTARAYDPVGNVTSVTDARQKVTHFEYDSRNLQTLTTDPLGNPTATAYDANGNTTLVTDALGHATTLSYDSLNRQTQLVDALQHATTTGYDAVGNITKVTDPLGRATSFAYDALNRLTWTATPLFEPTTTAYDAEGNVTRVTDPLVRSTSYAYDAANRQTLAVDRFKKATSFAYDEAGNRTLAVDRLERRTTFAYDELNRLTLSVEPLNHRNTTAYDAVGNVTLVTDPLTHSTSFEYDAANRQTKSIDARNEPSARAYDAAGNLTRVTDAEGNRTTFEYDDVNRVVRDTNELLKPQRYEYDGVGNLTAQIDRNGRRRSFTYDPLNRRTHELWKSATNVTLRDIASAYDEAGQLTLVSDPAATYRFVYDDDGQLESVDNNGTQSVPRVRFSYSYDALGNRTKRDQRIGNSSGVSGRITSTYDAESRLRKLVQEGDGLAKLQAEFGYDAEAELTSIARTMLSTGRSVIKSTLGYYADGRLRTLSHTGAGVVENYSYAYDFAGRMVRKSSIDGLVTYAYDEANQLTGADYSVQADETFGYDGTGNRTNAGYATDPDNRLRADGRFTYSYDDQGNLIQRTETATGANTQYAWDFRNRLTGVETRDGSGQLAQTVTYIYDPLDRRIQKTVATGSVVSQLARVSAAFVGPLRQVTDELPFVGPIPLSALASSGSGIGTLLAGGGVTTTTVFAYDGDEVALQFNGSGNLTHSYLGGPGLDQPLADQTVNGPKRWVLTDHQGSVTDLINTSNGAVENRIRYTGFGTIASQTNPKVTTLFGFTGQQQDPETGLTYLRARYYDPATGRFVSQDPTGFSAGDVNLFRYASNNPITRFDRTGFDDESVNEEDDEVYQSTPPSEDQVQSLAEPPSEQVQTLIPPEDDVLVPTDTENGTDSERAAGDGEVSATSDDFDGGWKDEAVQSKPQLSSQDLAAQDGTIISQPDFGSLLEGSVFSDEYLARQRASEEGRIESPLLDPIDLVLIPGLGSAIRFGLSKLSARATASSLATDTASSAAVAQTKALRPYYPPNRGFQGQPEDTILQRGTVLDRFGSESGTFASPAGTAIEARSLPPGTPRRLSTYEVQTPFSVKAGRVAPYFGQQGGGTQFEFPASVTELIEAGILKRVNK